jgi:hypothetical protein
MADGLFDLVAAKARPHPGVPARGSSARASARRAPACEEGAPPSLPVPYPAVRHVTTTHTHTWPFEYPRQSPAATREPPSPPTPLHDPHAGPAGEGVPTQQAVEGCW